MRGDFRTVGGHAVSAAAAMMIVAGCETIRIAPDNLQCDSWGQCIDGYECDTATNTCQRPKTGCVDVDGDGYGIGNLCAGPDCDDDPLACGALCSPGNSEICDNNDYDEDCDGFADDADPEGAFGRSTYYADRDNDTYGDPGAPADYCDPPATMVADDSDCADNLAACTTDCSTDTDRAGEPDCVEVACGTQPLVDEGAFECKVQGDLSNLVEGDHVLLNASFVSASVTIPANVTIRSAAGVVVTASEDRLFNIIEDNVTLDGLHIRGFQDADFFNDVVRVDDPATSATIVNCVIEDAQRSGIRIDTGGNPSNSRVMNNIVIGTRGTGNNRAGIVIKRTSGNTVVGNLIVGGEDDGIEVNDTAGTLIDNNTIVGNAGNGVLIHGFASTGLCMRNNLIVDHNGGAALSWTVAANTWAALCQTDSRNNGYNNANLCAGIECTDCTCIPDATFWVVPGVDPAFSSTNLDEADHYCPTESSLVDTASELGYDRNGDSPGLFNGIGPDIGGRESGAAGCP